MKILLFIISIVVLLGLVSCVNNADSTPNQDNDVTVEDNIETVEPDFTEQEEEVQSNGSDILEITEPDFAEQIEEIQNNRDDFLGRVIRYEGTFLSVDWEPTGETLYYVARVGGGCCGFYGFEVYLYDIPPFDDETWVEITGTLEEFFVEEANRYFLRLNAISIYEREEM